LPGIVQIGVVGGEKEKKREGRFQKINNGSGNEGITQMLWERCFPYGEYWDCGFLHSANSLTKEERRHDS